MMVQGEGYTLIEGDCLEVMAGLDGPVDAIIADLPYGTTACEWDSVIPLDKLWVQFKRLIKPNGAIVLFGQQPFTTTVIASNFSWFRYAWVWMKNRTTGHGNANKMPMKNTEDLCVFYNHLPIFNPQGLRSCRIDQRRKDKRYAGLQGIKEHGGIQTLTGYPKTLIENISAEFATCHPTQKPVDLLAYLIRTYTNPGETVLDCTCGSGTTIVAAIQEGRKGIGIDDNAGYFDISVRRCADASRAARGLPKQLTDARRHDDLPLFAGGVLGESEQITRLDVESLGSQVVVESGPNV